MIYEEVQIPGKSATRREQGIRKSQARIATFLRLLRLWTGFRGISVQHCKFTKALYQYPGFAHHLPSTFCDSGIYGGNWDFLHAAK
jgi:hypothetical protein